MSLNKRIIERHTDLKAEIVKGLTELEGMLGE